MTEKHFTIQPEYSDIFMSRAGILGISSILMVTLLIIGCTDVRTGLSLPDGTPDPIVGIWSSQEPNHTTVYRFWENGTFDAWSQTGYFPYRNIYQYSGEWKPAGSHEYTTEGPHIGYGDVTALAIWRKLTLFYVTASDTLSIPVYQNTVLSRLSYDPDAPV